MPHKQLFTVQVTVSQPTLDSLQPGAQGRHSQERRAALMTSKISAASQHHIASLRCHRRHPRQTFPLPEAYLVSKEHVIDDVIIDHRGLIHQRGDLPAGPALLNPLEQEDEPIHGAAERKQQLQCFAPTTPLRLLCPAPETFCLTGRAKRERKSRTTSAIFLEVTIPATIPPARHY